MSLGHALFLAYLTGWATATVHSYDLDTKVAPLAPKGAATFTLAAVIGLTWPLALPLQLLAILMGKR